MTDESVSFINKSSLPWRLLGEIKTVHVGRMSPPDKTLANPAIYFLEWCNGSERCLYIGETKNLKRRLGQYCRPSKLQHTAARINKTLQENLIKGISITVYCITDCILANISSKQVSINLNSKMSRCYFENLTLLEASIAGFKIFNLGENLTFKVNE